MGVLPPGSAMHAFSARRVPRRWPRSVLRTLDYGHDLDTDEMRERFTPWFHALDVVSERDPAPESLAAMARLPWPAAGTNCPSRCATAPMPSIGSCGRPSHERPPGV
ncbi:hypothetical protein STANM309S_04129 [Streptomyces tanashiensis]